MKYMFATHAIMGGILNILSLAETLPVFCIDCSCQLQLPVTSTAYLVWFREL